jgi:GxxExxY protein
LFASILFPHEFMPISFPIPIRPIDQEEFAKLDYNVMRHAFDSQNELGRLCDEVIYQNDLAERLDSARLGPIHKEVRVDVTHGNFAKAYFLDLVVGDTAIYELKTAVCLAAEHDSQLLNYLFLCGSSHGKLINFRSAQVESKFVNSGLTREARWRLEFDQRRWLEVDRESQSLRAILVGLLEDWGGFLEVPLYIEAVVHFLGGENAVLRMIPLSRGTVSLGNQRLHMLGPETAFRITGLTEDAVGYERQLRSLLDHSPLRAIQWINVARHRISFVTLDKSTT